MFNAQLCESSIRASLSAAVLSVIECLEVVQIEANVNIQISDDAAKMIMAGVVILGLGYLTYKYFDGLPRAEIPLPQEAEKFSEIPSVKPSSIDEIGYNQEVRKRALPLLEKSLWRDAVRESAIALFDVLRAKSGIDDDATRLVRKAFRGATCRLKFVGIAPSHITNADEGLIHYLEGFCTHTRKIHMHTSVEVSKQDALWIVNLAAYLADRIENNTVLANPVKNSEGKS